MDMVIEEGVLPFVEEALQRGSDRANLQTETLIEILSLLQHLSADRQPRPSIHDLRELQSQAPGRIHHYRKLAAKSVEDPAFSGLKHTGFLLPIKPKELTTAASKAAHLPTVDL
jgi:hypothetical protein